MISTEQPVHHRRLMLFGTADLRQRQAQFAAHSCRHVLKAQRFGFDAVHQDHAHARERIVIQFADRLADHIAPGKALLVEGVAFRAEKI
jgi:hypothetical protein